MGQNLKTPELYSCVKDCGELIVSHNIVISNLVDFGFFNSMLNDCLVIFQSLISTSWTN